MASLQILSAWGCVVIALGGLLLYSRPDFKDIDIVAKKKQITRRILSFCVILSLWVLFWSGNTNPEYLSQKALRIHFESAVSQYHKSYAEEFSAFSPSEVVDITNQLNDKSNFGREYIAAGTISVVVKNKVCFLQYNINELAYYNHGVPFLGPWMFFEKVKAIKNLKKDMAGKDLNLNSPDLDMGLYDGKGDSFFQKIYIF
jgi:hypothetical protein